MTFFQKTPEFLRTKLYQKNKEFKEFKGLNIEDLVRIANKIYYKQEINQLTPQRFYPKDKLTKYTDTLTYLTNPLIHTEIPSYDERIIFLIMSADPDLISFKEFLKSNIIPLQSIEKEKDPIKKEELNEQRKNAILDLQSRIRKQIGFYDSKLIRYEEIYFKKFISELEIINKVKQDNITKLLAIMPFITSLDSITDVKYQELQKKAEIWHSLTNCENDLYTAAYSCVQQTQTIGLENILEQLVFFILISDPELNALKIYEEESRTDIIKERITEELHYYNPNLIKLESIYHARFCPDKELSPWTFG